MESGKNPSPAAAEEFQVIQKIMLPHIEGKEPGPLHTVVTDPEGNLYYSDEMNHSVVALCNDGALRWHKTKRGNAPGEFWYPRGLSLGFIQSKGETIRCLAVADAWNRRVQFLDLSGTPIHAWTHVNDTEFAEVVDVRYIRLERKAEGTTEQAGYWVALDKRSHRLCAVDKNGSFLFQVGRGFPPSLEIRWVIPGLLLEKDNHNPGFIKNVPEFDFVFYPERILGDSENALYLWEPYSLRLKQVLLGNLLPLNFASKGIEWVTADNSGIIGWQRDNRHFLFYDCHGQLKQEFECLGTPVSSNLPSNEFWLQKEDQIERQHFKELRQTQGGRLPLKLCSPLHLSSETELSMMDSKRIRETISDWTTVVDELLELRDRLKSINDDVDARQLNQISDALKLIDDKRHNAEQHLYSALHHLSLGVLEYRLSELDIEKRSKSMSRLRDQWNILAGPIQKRFTQIQDCLDELWMFRILLSNKGDHEYLMECVHQVETFLNQVLEWIMNWSGIVDGTIGFQPMYWILQMTNDVRNRACIPGHMIYHAGEFHYPGLSTYLREIACIKIANDGEVPQPLGLAYSSTEGIFVSLCQSRTILQLDLEGKIIDRIGSIEELGMPAHVALDATGMLWVADFKNHCILKIDLKRREVKTYYGLGLGPNQFDSPYGICARPNGSILVADGSHRISRIAPDENIDHFYAKVGRAREELLDPISFCNSTHDSFWIVDRRNHRLLRFTDEGIVTREIGKCGLRDGELFMPEAVAEFEDGIMAVAQNSYNRSIKLFSASGVELGKMPLTYFAPAMLVISRKLYVTDISCGALRVYERVTI